MGFLNYIHGLLGFRKEVDLSKLPSLGLFYKDNLKIWIKKTDDEDVFKYEFNYDPEKISSVIDGIKSILKSSLVISNGNFGDIKSIDIIFLFLEIVKFKKNKDIKITYDGGGVSNTISFGPNTFNYCDVSDVMKYYNKDLKVFDIDGWKFSAPSISIEESVTNYLIHKNDESLFQLNYNFINFMGDKKELNFDEIENLIQIFNYDLPKEDNEKIGEIISMFFGMMKYSLIKDGLVIDMNAKMDLSKIWQ